MYEKTVDWFVCPGVCVERCMCGCERENRGLNVQPNVVFCLCCSRHRTTIYPHQPSPCFAHPAGTRSAYPQPHRHTHKSTHDTHPYYQPPIHHTQPICIHIPLLTRLALAAHAHGHVRHLLLRRRGPRGVATSAVTSAAATAAFVVGRFVPRRLMCVYVCVCCGWTWQT